MPPTTDSRLARATGTSLVLAVGATELILTAGEFALLGMPVFLSLRVLPRADGLYRIFLPVAVALCAALVLRLFDALRPVALLLSAKRRLEAVSTAEADAGQRALVRAPRESAVLRFIVWTALPGTLLAVARLRGHVATLPAFGLLTAGALHAAAAAAARVLVLENVLGRVRPVILPNLEGIRVFSRAYRAWLALVAVASLGFSHAGAALMLVAFVGAPNDQVALLTLLGFAILAPAAVLWWRSMRRRTAPIEAYFDATLRSPGTRGPARDEPKAVTAFVVAQSLPYRLAGYQAFSLALAGVVAVAVGRWLTGFEPAVAGRMLLVLAVVVLASTLYAAMVFRMTLRPLMKHIGSRHHLPVREVRSQVGLRPKLLAFFVGETAIGCGFVSLFDGAPDGAGGWGLLALAMGGGLSLSLVLLMVRELVAPIQALETRSEEIARGELARPVPPSGEADEIGRLSVAFEEMRRSLRDRLRSTESINVDLEREVRRRTEALEQRNTELRDALQKLRQAQDSLIRSEKLASMGRLVAGIAHEINNPVNAIINSLGPLEQVVREIVELPQGGDVVDKAKAAQEMLGVIARGTSRTKAVVQALHNYSRGDESIPREVNLSRSVDDSVDLLRHRMRNVKVVKDIDPRVHVQGFPGQIDQVLMNLLTNATQAFGDRPGTIRVGAALRPTGDAAVWVADDGPGIPPDVLPHIFDPFFTTMDVGEGAGLGLSIVHGIVERHGATIDVESAPGAGTTFTIVFPAKAATAAV